MTFRVEDIEVFLLILVRITAFIYVAPFFSLKNVPQKVKVGFSLFFSIIIFETVSVNLDYDGVIGFAALVISEALVGLVIGFLTNVSYFILNFAGQLIDMEIGLSMVNELDPTTNIQTTITSNLYTYLFVLMMLVTNLHHYIITAMVDTYQVIPVGGATLNPNLYLLMLKFIKDYFIIGFRIVLPVFAGMLIVNTILGILAKIAPQMNMFVIGFQLKIMVGLIILYILTLYLPNISDFIFNEMFTMMKSAVNALSP